MKLGDVEDVGNMLLLCEGIKEAFDCKEVSFVPSSNSFSGSKYQLHVWDEGVRDMPIFEGSLEAIGSYDGRPLNL